MNTATQVCTVKKKNGKIELIFHMFLSLALKAQFLWNLSLGIDRKLHYIYLWCGRECPGQEAEPLLYNH